VRSLSVSCGSAVVVRAAWDIARGDIAIVPIGGFQQVPGAVTGVRCQDQPFTHLEGLVVIAPQFVGTVGDPRILLRIRRFALQLHALHLIGYVQPQLDDQRSVVAQHAFETLDLLAGHRELLAVDGLVHRVLGGAGVPGAQEDADLPPGRQATPEAVEKRALFLLVGGFPIGVGADAPGVHPFVEPVNQRALAGPVEAGDHDDYRVIPLREVKLGLQQLLPERQLQLVEVGFPDFFADFQCFEHVDVPIFRRVLLYRIFSAGMSL
jgi:hypothetical protein